MLAWIFSFDYPSKWRNLKKNPYWLFIFLFFCLSLLGMIYTSNSYEGWKDVTVKMSLLLLPLPLASSPALSAQKLKLILKTFVLSISIAIVVLLVMAWSRYSIDGSTRHFFYGNFASLRRVPAHYFSLYINLAFFITLFYFFKDFSKLKFSGRLAYIALLILQLSALYLCSVRIQFLALLIGLIVFFIRFFRKKLKPLQIALSLIGIFSVLIITALLIPESKRRIIETMDEYSAFRGREELKQMNHRVFLWKYGTEVIKENVWIGTGTGSANDHLHEYLKEEKAQFWDGKGIYLLGEKKYNFHNEFLQNFATHGILGLLLISLILFRPLFQNDSEFGMLCISFLILCIISFMTESMLERQAGNLFFAFFYSVLVINRNASKN